jgi:hypothetical protein
MKKVLVFTAFIGAISLGYFFTQSSIKTSYSFYHWKSTYEVDTNERKTPRYVKVLDISYSDTFFFKKTSFKTLPTKKIVPVIYIDSPLWSKMKAKTMVSKILKSLESMPIKYDEIQVDCDWTDRSRQEYFNFLKLLKKESSKIISVTIRLHQVKYYQKTGVPPVNYGVLMYYNMSDFRDIKSKNYILDLEVAKQYHYNFDTYPLELNLALPLYSQATIIRFSKVVGLIEGLKEKELSSNFIKIKEHLYEVNKTHYFKERLFYKGDKVRVDEVTIGMLKDSIDGLRTIMKEPKEIIFYRWGNHKDYDEERLYKIF